MIDCQKSLESLFDPDLAQGDHAGLGLIPYISDLQTIGDLHKILLDAASGLSPVGSPAVLAWSIILKAMRETSMARKEARELRQSVRAEEAFEEDASFDEETGYASRTGRPRPARRFSAGSESSVEAGMYDEFLESTRDVISDEDPIQYLAYSAIDGSHVFDVLTSLAVFFGTVPYADMLGSRIRLSVLTLTRCSIEVMEYAPEIINTTLVALTGNRNFWDLAESQQSPSVEDPLLMFLGDDYFGQKLLNNAMARYPYEPLPFLKIIHAIASCQTLHDEGVPVALRPLERMPSFTFQLPQDFRDYETIQEEDNANTIQLIRDVELFKPRKIARLTGTFGGKYSTSVTLTQTQADFIIPRGTPGRIVSDSDSGPKVAQWFQEYSGLKYMGKLLETSLTASDYVDATMGEPVDGESVAEIIGLLATLLLTSTKIEESSDINMEPHASAYRILEDASDGLDRNRDIVGVVFKIFEEELERQSASLDNDAPLDILVACVQFIYALVPVLPSRVWPLLGRSKLLDIDGQGGRLSSVLARVEIVSCRYDFLLSCIHLFHALVEDSVRHALRRKIGSKSLVRHGSKEDQGTGVPEQLLSNILSSYTRTLVDVFESACNWRFAIQEQRLQLSELILRGFNNILYYTHGIDDSSRREAKLTKSLMPAAQYIIEAFLSPKSGHLRYRPIMRSLLDGISSPEILLQSSLGVLSLREVRASIILAITLLKLSVLVDRPKSQLEHQFFKLSPLIARLYVMHESYRILVVQLLEALVLCASSREEEPPSLLGHLGRKTSKNFIQMLLELDKPLNDAENVTAIWHLMSVVISSRQQWFSIYLLTGRPPREALKEAKPEKPSWPAKTALKIALDALTNVHDLPMPRATAMLEFISLAQNYWPWAMSDLHIKQSNFIKGISEFVSILAPAPVSASEERMMQACYQIRMAAYIAEILAMYLYHSRQLGNTAPVTDVLPHIEFYTRCAVSAPNYNVSLHGNLKRNFEAMYSGCSLQDFKLTQLDTREYGREYFYDINFADKMLNSDQAWTGRKSDGLAEELAKANINLSLVDAQVVSIEVILAGNCFNPRQALLHGWKLLATELSASLQANPSLEVTLSNVVKDSLIANNRSQPPENIFARITQTRADLALILLQRLSEAKCTKPEFLSLLSAIWETLRNLESSYEAVLMSGDADYYRSLLKMLFLALRANASREQAPKKTSNTPDPRTPSETQKIPSASTTVRIILDVLRQVVARGFHDLVAAIHERPTESVADDIGLVTAILQACLHVSGIEFSYTEILQSMVEFDAARVATTLFSWSDKFAVDGDPIYGELSTLFLLELSSIAEVAEQLAVEGTLGHISNASITSFIRRGNISSLSEGLGPQRCYSIWVRGILPLLLNILDAVGGSIAAEAAIFLNQFPKLLQQSVEAIDVPHSRLGAALPPPRITYLMVSEVHSLALLKYILSNFRISLAGNIDVPEVKWDYSNVLESVDHWLTERAVLRERIMPLSLREMEMAKQKPLSAGTECENRLEEKVVQELLGIRDVLTGGEES